MQSLYEKLMEKDALLASKEAQAEELRTSNLKMQSLLDSKTAIVTQ